MNRLILSQIKLMKHWFLVVIGAVTLGFLSSCTRGVTGGNPKLPLSNTNGTTRVLEGSELALATAITNAFKDLRYREMYLVEDTLVRQEVGHRFSETNGFVLMPFSGDGSIGTIPLATGKTVRYCADFYITTKPASSNQTIVTVHTARAGVLDGQETGIHGGLANHYRDIPPVRREEENVLTAIAEELKREKSKSDEN